MTQEFDQDAIDAEIRHQHVWIEEVERRASKFRILSTLPYPKIAFWNRVVTTVASSRNFLTPLTRKIDIPDIFIVFRLLARANKYQIVLLTGGERADLVYAALSSLCPWIHTRNVIVDAHWQKAGGVFGTLQTVLLRLARRKLAQVQPHSKEEIDIYSAAFAIPTKIMKAIPWSTALIGYNLTPSTPEQPLILSGGFSLRDYETFIPAAAASGAHTRLGVPASEVDASLRALVAKYPSVELHTDWSNMTYYQQMAGCSVYAMPIQQGLTRSTADRTILNAMYFGKIVVATDSIAPRIYIEHGVNGFLVQEPTVEAWTEALRTALSLSSNERLRITERASYDAKVSFNEDMRLARTLEAVTELLEAENSTR